jgi:hypothetical protein
MSSRDAYVIGSCWVSVQHTSTILLLLPYANHLVAWDCTHHARLITFFRVRNPTSSPMNSDTRKACRAMCYGDGLGRDGFFGVCWADQFLVLTIPVSCMKLLWGYSGCSSLRRAIILAGRVLSRRALSVKSQRLAVLM